MDRRPESTNSDLQRYGPRCLHVSSNPGRETRKWTRWALAAVLVAYVLVGAIYSVTTPVFEAPDESHHFFVVKYLIDQRSLPVQRANLRGPWEQEGSQPPLYYLVCAPLIAWIDLGDAEDLLWLNPQANIGDPMNPGNKNRYIHSADQDYPWQGTVLAVHVLRFFSLLLGASTVALVWGIVNRISGQPALAVTVAAATAFIPQYLFITSAVNNDNAMSCLGALSLYVLVRLLRDELESGSESLRGWWLQGIVLGLALLSKLSAIALLGLVGVVIAVCAWRRRSWRALWKRSLAVLVPAMLIAGWWYVRNVVLYGEPTGLTAMWEIVGRRDDFGEDLWGEFRGVRYSFWGLFGWFSIPMASWAYRLLDAVSLFALIGALASVVRSLRTRSIRDSWQELLRSQPGQDVYRPLALAVLALWTAITAVSLVRWTSLTHGSQGRLLYAAIAPLSLFFVLGVTAWFPARGRVRDWVGGAVALSICTLGVASPWLWIAPQYARPAQVSGLPAGTVPMSLTFGDAVALHGVRFGQESVRPGDTLTVNLYWEALRPLPDEGEIVVWLRMIKERPLPEESAGGVVALEDSYPGSGAFPTSLWPVGQMLEGRQHIRVGDDTPAPMVARLDIDLYREHSQERLTPSIEGLATIGRVKVVPRQWPSVGEREVAARFDCGITLARYEATDLAAAGDRLPVKLTWAVQAAPRRDYVVFVHLEDAEGNIWGYGDGPPRGGNYPTWWWAVGEVVVDDHVLSIAPDTPPGRYRLTAGLYDTSGRVAAYAPGGLRLPDDAIDLATLEIK